jgi:hypothetical protein
MIFRELGEREGAVIPLYEWREITAPSLKNL